MSKDNKKQARREEKFRNELARYEERFRDESQKARRAGLREGLVIAAVPAISSVVVALVPVMLPPAEAAPPTYVCTESFDRALEMYETNGVWMALPEDSEEEQYCEVNDRMIALFDLPPGETVYVNPIP